MMLLLLDRLRSERTSNRRPSHRRRGSSRKLNLRRFLQSERLEGRELLAIDIAAADASRLEGDMGVTAFTFDVTRSGDTSQALTLDFQVQGSGANPADAADFGRIISVSTASGFNNALANAVVGDEIVLEPGTYAGGFFVTNLNGVTIRSADPSNRAVINAQGFGEGLKLSSPKNVIVRDLIIEKASSIGLHVDDGSHVEIADGVTLQNILIRNGGGDGIKLTGVDNFHVDRVQVIGWSGFGNAVNLLGSHFGIVERSYFENSTPASGTGVQTKGGSTDIAIRGNRFWNANERSIQIGGATSSSAFRPQPPGDVEAARIVAEGNFIFHNGNVGQGIRSAVSFVNVADGVFRNNVVVRPSLYAVRILKENRNPGFINTQNGTISNNIFLWNQGDLSQVVNVGSQTLPATFTFAGNQWYNATSPGNSQLPLPSPETGGIYGVDPQLDYRGITPWNFSWGTWLVNTSDLPDTETLDSGQTFRLAIPGPGAVLDIGQANPLIGSWTVEPVTSTTFSVSPFSHAVLINDTVPDPSPGPGGGEGFPSGKVSFGVGDTMQTVTINVRGEVLEEPDEEFTVTLTDPSGTVVFNSDSANGTIWNDDGNTLAPAVETVVIDDGTIQRSRVRSLTLTFNRVVSLDEGAISVQKVGGALVNLQDYTPTVVNGKTQVVVTFTGTEIIGGSLADGNYSLTVHADKVHVGSQTLAADYVESFFRFFGDLSGDRRVGLSEFNALRSAFGASSSSPAYVAALDWTGDGVIGLNDFNAFRARFLQTLPPPV